MSKYRTLMTSLGAFALAMLSAASIAQTKPVTDYKSAADVPVTQFFSLPDFRDVRLSPDGKRIAAVAPYKGRGNLIVVDLATREAKSITATDRWDVGSIRWIGNNRLYFTISDGQEASGQLRIKGAYSIAADGSDMREVFGYNDNGSPRGLRVTGVLDTEGGDSTVAYVAMRQRSREWSDVYKLDFRTLKFELVSFESPGRTSGWLLDSKRNPRIAVRYEPRPAKGKPYARTIWHRAATGGTWEKLFELSSHDNREDLDVCGFDSDDRTLYISARRDRDKAALWKYDTQARQWGELMVDDPIVDVGCGQLLTDPETKQVIALSYQSDRPKKVFFGADSQYLRFEKQLAASIPGFTVINTIKDKSRSLVFAYSDIDPGTYYLYDAKKNQLEVIAKARSWVKPELMAERRFIQYKGRDGQLIPAYVTLPRGVPAKNLPLIVNIHGGPQVRGYQWAEWGRWPEAQFFASRGYAVLEPEPRASTGYGYKLHVSGFKQWGQAAQDDITDGALHLVKEGIVDKDRMCLHGGSYGGYASLQGLVREPDLFKCAHSFVAVTDLGLMQSVAWSDTAQDTEYDYLENEFKLEIGDSKDDAEMFQRVSPARNADKIKGAVMLTMGSDDVRVPLIHGEKMRDAMIKAGKPIEWKVYAEEGHGFNREANVTDFYTRSLRFYDEQIGPKRKAQP